MAFVRTTILFALTFALFVQGSFGNIECENLNKDSCAFAVSSTGKRCVLEKHVRRSGQEVYVCSSSEIEAAKQLKNQIETDECIQACGLQRNVLGISSDYLLDSCFTHKLCSNECYNNCPNIVDLYFNLAAGEGTYLPKLCQAKKGPNARREMAEIQSSGYVAPGPISGYANGVYYAAAPATSPYAAATAMSPY